MKERLEKKQAELQEVVNKINNGRQQVSQLENSAIELQGQVKLLTEMIEESEKENTPPDVKE